MGRFRWRSIASSVPNGGTDEIYDVFVAEDSVVDGDKGIFFFITRGDYRAKTATSSAPTRIQLAYWAIGCTTRKLFPMEGMEVDSGGVLRRRSKADENAKLIDVQEGTVGAIFFDYICKASICQKSPQTERTSGR